jgi:hypothetical protein
MHGFFFQNSRARIPILQHLPLVYRRKPEIANRCCWFITLTQAACLSAVTFHISVPRTICCPVTTSYVFILAILNYS